MRCGAVADYRLFIIRYHLDMTAELKPYPTMKDSGVEWLGMVPEHWEVAQVKRHYSIQLGKMLQNGPKTDDDFETQYLKAQHVQWFSVRISDAPKMWASRRDIEQFGVSSGDLLVCEGGEGGRSGMVYDIPPGYIIQNALHRVRPLGSCLNDYLLYVMNSVSSKGWFTAINNKATIAHFTCEKFGALKIPIPPLPEQVAIARYLDYVDVRVRRLTEAKRKLIGLLTEQKQAIIYRAVTRGLDPNVPLKDSGIEWLGMVPQHWEVRRLKTVSKVSISGINRDIKENETPVRFLGTDTVYKSGRIGKTTVLQTASATDAEIVKFALRCGDLIVTKDSLVPTRIAVPAIVTEDLSELSVCGYHLALVRPRKNLLSSPYLHYTFQTIGLSDYFVSVAQGTTIIGIGLSEINGAIVPLPPIAEQVAIVEYLDRATAEIDIAVARTERQIELLNEYRTRLIADVVTGKLDVRDATLTTEDTDTSTALASTDSAHRSDLDRGA